MNTNDENEPKRAEGVALSRLVRPLRVARPWEHGLPTSRWEQEEKLRVHPNGIRVGEREIPKELTDRKDDGKLWCGDYVRDGDKLYIAKYNWGGQFTLHRFVFRFLANARIQPRE